MAERLDYTRDLPKEKSFNEDLTARPQDVGASTEEDLGDFTSQPFDHGRTEEEDAKLSGYIDENGQAVSTSKTTEGKGAESSTGSYTDLGRGRSSAVRKP